MSAALMTVYNPGKRRKHKRRGARKSRKGKMPAALKRYWAAKRRGAAPKRHKRRARRSIIATETNPMRKHRKHRRRSNPSRRRSYRRRRNPTTSTMAAPSFSTRSITGYLSNAATGAAGALAVDIGMGYVAPYLPAVLATGPGYVAAKSGVAFLAGVAAKPMIGGRMAAKVVEGSLICTLRDFGRGFIPASVALGAYSNAAPMARLGSYVPARLSAFSRQDAPTLRGRTGASLLGRTGRGLLGRGFGA